MFTFLSVLFISHLLARKRAFRRKTGHFFSVKRRWFRVLYSANVVLWQKTNMIESRKKTPEKDIFLVVFFAYLDWFSYPCYRNQNVSVGFGPRKSKEWCNCNCWALDCFFSLFHPQVSSFVSFYGNFMLPFFPMTTAAMATTTKTSVAYVLLIWKPRVLLLHGNEEGISACAERRHVAVVSADRFKAWAAADSIGI